MIFASLAVIPRGIKQADNREIISEMSVELRQFVKVGWSMKKEREKGGRKGRQMQNQ